MNFLPTWHDLYIFWLVLLFLLCFSVVIAATYFNFSIFIASIRTKGVPYVPTMNSEIKVMNQGLGLKKNKTVLDLGCGDGKALRYLVKNYNLKKGVGYDLNHCAINYGKIINRFKEIKNVELIYGNFYKLADLSKYDYIFIYLLTEHMKMYEEWIFSGIRDDAIIISNTFQFEKHKPYKSLKNHKGKERIFYYKK